MTNKLLVNIFAEIASYTSLIALAFSFNSDWNNWGLGIWLWVIATSGAIIYILIIRWLEYVRARIKEYPTGSPKIKEYMHDLLKDGGNCAIFTRDMTWGHDEKLKGLLMDKARKNELNVFAPKMSDLVQELEQAGARVFCYSALDVSPQSRFTIANWKRDGAHIAVGRPLGRTHYISEHNYKEEPLFAVAEDLLSMLEKTCRKE